MKRKIGTSSSASRNVSESHQHHYHSNYSNVPERRRRENEEIDSNRNNHPSTYKTPFRSSSYSGRTMFGTVFCLLFLLQLATGTIYINYDTSIPILRRNITSLTNYNATVQQSTSTSGGMDDSGSLPNMMGSTITVAYDTLPGLFGRYMMDGVLYQARIQYLPENPYLCSLDGITSFQPPSHIINTTWSNTSDNSSSADPKGNNITTTSTTSNNNTTAPASDDTNTTNVTSSMKGNEPVLGDAIILLVARGQCPFYQKALNAEQLHPNIIFLAIYNNPADNTLVPMYSQSVTTRLVLLSLSYNAGQEIMQYVSNVQAYNNTIYQQGGPHVELDSVFPVGIMPPNWVPGNDITGGGANGNYNDGQHGLFNMQDLQQTFISVIGLFLLTVSCMGIMILIATLYSQHRRYYYANYVPGAANNNAAGNPNDPSIKLLSVDDVKQLYKLQFQKQTQDELEPQEQEGQEQTAVASTDNEQPVSTNPPALEQQHVKATTIDQPFDEVPLNENEKDRNDDNNEEENDDENELFNHVPENACAICLEEITGLSGDKNTNCDDCLATTTTTTPDKEKDPDAIDEDAALLLPCGQHHRFHYSCIMPWLTERQAKCPLCKYDVYEYMRQMKEEQQDGANAAGGDVDKEQSDDGTNSELSNATTPALQSDQHQPVLSTTTTPTHNSGPSFLRRFTRRQHPPSARPTPPTTPQQQPSQLSNDNTDNV